jgi:hypothetical protein
MSFIKKLKTIYKYGIGIRTFSLDIGGVCALPKVRVLQTFQ